jgi:hypothetical protein
MLTKKGARKRGFSRTAWAEYTDKFARFDSKINVLKNWSRLLLQTGISIDAHIFKTKR